MATVKRTTTNGEAPQGEVTPEEAAKIRASAAGKEQAPSTREQAQFVEWRKVADQLGDPFEVERIPISKLRAMRRDSMLGFGLIFIKTPHVRAKWFINAKDRNGPNAQIAAHLDHDIRRIYSSYVLQWMNCLDFGWQSLAKRFEFRIPSGTYIEIDPETGEQAEKPLWSEGSIEPIAFKTFVALPPENVEPNWTPQGEFDGIRYFPPKQASVPGGIGASRRSSSNEEEGYDIDLYHSLWVTNERDQNFGNIYGYPRLGYAYKPWWSFWFRWAIADRAFERKGDPTILVKHPSSEIEHPLTGEIVSAGEYALEMADRMRSGGSIAVPSEPYEDVNGRGTMPMWDISALTDLINFDPFDKSFDYLDVQKLRSLFIPEQAFLEGKGGTSSRNVAAELSESFIEQQGLLYEQMRESINRWVIPQWLAVNYPEFVINGGTAELITKGFAEQDVEFTKQVLQLIGQQESGMRELVKIVDLTRIAEDAGMPIRSFTEQKRIESQLAEEAAAANGPPPTEPIPGLQVGVVPAQNGTGFSYIQPREIVTLADAPSTAFIENLPDSPHYRDRTIKGFSRQLWDLYHDLYADEYESAVAAIAEAEDEPVEMAAKDFIDRARGLLAAWRGSDKWPTVLQRSIDIFGSIARRASRLELDRVRLSNDFPESDWEEWLRQHLADTASKVAETTRSEVQNFIAARMDEGITDRQQIADLARAHFSDFPGWKADRLVRTEVRDIYNAATLLSARAAGIDTVQASDADSGETDADCMERDGQIFSVESALRESEHPNGTLAWRILPATQLSIERVDVEDGDPIGRYDIETETVYLSNQATADQAREYLKIIGDWLVQNGVSR